MTWLERVREAVQNPDLFWAKWHRERRFKRLEHWERERRKHLQRAFSAGRMAQYYHDQLYGSPYTPDDIEGSA